MRDDVARAAALRALEIAREAKAMKSEKGEKGEPGEVRVLNVPVPGDQGPMGPSGARGPMGPYGPRGVQGDRGDPGPQGPEGKQGPTGSNGKDGKDGAAGPKGERGPKGDKGDKGDLGPMPKHERKGLMFRFEKAPGEWGEWIIVPTAGGGGGRDDKLTDLQKQLVEIGDLVKGVASNSGKVIGSDGADLVWTEGGAGGGAVDSVNGQTGVVVLDAADVGALPSTGGTVTGPTVVEMSSTSTALRVTQTGTGNALVVEDAANPDSSPFVVTSAGLVGIRNSSPSVALDVVGSVQISQTLGVAGSLIDVDSGNAYIQTITGTTYFGSSSNLVLEAGVQTALEADGTTQNVGIGVAPNTSKLAVGGVVESTTGGFKFPDGTTQTTASTGGGALTVQDEGSTLTSAATSLNFTGAGVTATNTGGAVTVAITGGGGGISSADIQEFTTTGTSTWTKPAGAKIVYVLMQGGGGGGASGHKQLATPVNPNQGGTGGGGGGWAELWIPAVSLGATESVVVGAGGTGGASQTVSGNGNNGIIGGNSSFGSWAVARGGAAGTGGQAAAQGTGSTTNNTANAPFIIASQATVLTNSLGYLSFGGTRTAGLSGGSGGRGGKSAGGGGAGGGNTITPTATNGGTGGLGGAGVDDTTTGSNTGGGGTAGTSGGAGGNGANSVTYYLGGSGGGGGASSITANGGAGGAGGYPGGGGGGGGASTSSFNSGAGGNGGDGYVRIVTFF